MELLVERKITIEPYQEAQFRLGLNGDLQFYYKRRWQSVEVKKCFPWQSENLIVSVRRGDQEIYLIENLEDWSPSQKKLVKRFLAESQFVFLVVKVFEVEEEFELRRWLVQTQAGQRQFQTRANHWPNYLNDHSFVIQDLHGDLYKVEDLQELDGDSQKILWSFTG